MKNLLCDSGIFAFAIRTFFSLSGVGLIFFAVYFVTDKDIQWLVGLIGLVIGSVGMYATQAKILNLFPFTNDPLGWRKAKETYKTAAASDEITKNDDQA